MTTKHLNLVSQVFKGQMSTVRAFAFWNSLRRRANALVWFETLSWAPGRKKIREFTKLRQLLQWKLHIKWKFAPLYFAIISSSWSRCAKWAKCTLACLARIIMVFMQRQIMKDLLQRPRVVVRIPNVKFSCRRLVEYIKNVAPRSVPHVQHGC